MTEQVTPSLETPSGLIRALEMVRELLSAPSHRELTAKLEGDYESALNFVQPIVKREWVLKARLAWYSFCLNVWEEYMAFRAPEGPVDRFKLEHELGVRLCVLDHYLKTEYLGVERNQFMERYITILLWLRAYNNPDARKRDIQQVLKRRTGLERQFDPYADPLTYKLLCQHYDIPED